MDQSANHGSMSFNDVQSLQAKLGTGSYLTPDMCLEYFERSPFFDERSINWKRKKEGSTNTNFAADDFEYVVVSMNSNARGYAPLLNQYNDFPPMCIKFGIVVFCRRNCTTQVPDKYWYMCEGTIFEAPNFSRLLKHHTGRMADQLSQALLRVRRIVRQDLTSTQESKSVWVNRMVDVRKESASVEGFTEKIAVSFGEESSQLFSEAYAMGIELLEKDDVEQAAQHSTFMAKWSPPEPKLYQFIEQAEADALDEQARMAEVQQQTAGYFQGIMEETADY